VVLDEDTSALVAVLGNDSDPDGDLDPGSLAVTVAPGRGTATVEGSSIRYAPAANANGGDLFAYAVCDTGGRCATAFVSVTILPVNDAPTAGDDATSGVRLTPVVVTVLDNDGDIDGDSLAVLSADALSAAGGSVACDQTTCTYTPPDPWGGPDTFSYTVTDGAGGTASAVVTVTPDVADVVFALGAGGLGDQTSQPVLPLRSGSFVPANPVLPNYDTDRDAAPGLRLVETAGSPQQQLTQTDPARYQMWLAATSMDLTLTGPASLQLWAAMDQFDPGLRGRLRAFLLDCPPTSTTGNDCTLVAESVVDGNPWNGAGQWRATTFDFGTVAHVVSAGRAVAVKVVVAGQFAESPMRLGFDAVGFEAGLVIRPS
jgi:hypothetical protein